MTEATQKGQTIELDDQDLPAYCPHKSMPIWSSHPRVYLDLAHNSQATCPYCGTQYQLKPGTAVSAH